MHACAQGITYRGSLSATLKFSSTRSSADVADGELAKRLGFLPIMVKSRCCNLSGMSRSALVAEKEEANEMGGYFVCNGIERIIRCLVAQRRHYIMGLKRGAYKKRGANYTENATLLR